MTPLRMVYPSSTVDTLMLDGMEEEHQNTSEGKPGLETNNDELGDQGTGDTGCLGQDEPEMAHSTQDGDSEPSVYVDLEDLSNLAHLKDIKIAMEYVWALEVASLEDNNNQLDEEAIRHLHNPHTSPVDVSDPDF